MLWGSYSSSHTEHNKIGFAIFWVFLRIDMEFTSHWINSQNWEESIRTRPVETFELSQLCLRV
jgi:hypothetical protein